MKQLGQKNLFYSILLGAVLLGLLVGYFVWMLPPLYVSYMEEQNLLSVRRQHEAFVETGTYEGIQVKNPAACVSIKIPSEGSCLELSSKMVSARIEASDSRLQSLFRDMKQFMENFDLGKDNLNGKARAWEKKLKQIVEDTVQLPVRMSVKDTKGSRNVYYGDTVSVHSVSKNFIIIQSGIEDGNNHYTNYLAAEKIPDGMILSVLPVVTPQIGEIRPIVMQSLPMLCAVLLMLVLLFSRVYSNGIVLPVYQRLEQVNEELLRENERQEVFLRASSHQLKTPVTAALLLLDGMINQVGKYQDVKAHLPKVKMQLLSMRKMIEEILSIRHSCSYIDRQNVCLYSLAESLLANYSVAAADKHLEFILEGDKEECVYTCYSMLSKILDSLISNAAAYTPPGSRVKVSVRFKAVAICNYGAQIPSDMIQHIFEPFVSGSHGQSSHGLGLYIAAYYAKQLGARLSVQNKEGYVEAVLSFQDS